MTIFLATWPYAFTSGRSEIRYESVEFLSELRRVLKAWVAESPLASALLTLGSPNGSKDGSDLRSCALSTYGSITCGRAAVFYVHHLARVKWVRWRRWRVTWNQRLITLEEALRQARRSTLRRLQASCLRLSAKCSCLKRRVSLTSRLLRGFRDRKSTRLNSS